MESKRSRQSLENVTQLCRDSIWLETEAAVKTEATHVRDKLHQVRENYRRMRKYQMEDRTLKLDRQRLEDQRLIAQYEDEVEKLRKELKEATEAKEHELNTRNPDITNLNDHNRPTELGENFRELHDNEWTDAFEFLIEENGETLREDEETIDMLYAMLKHCNELCSEALREQQTSLAQLVSNPAYFKAQFGKTLPATSLSTSDQVSGRRRQLDKQGESKETASNGNKQHSNLKSGKMSDVYKTEQMTDATKPIIKQFILTFVKLSSFETKDKKAGETDRPVINADVEVPIKGFSKSVAGEVLKHVAVSDILPAISKDKQYQDVLQNAVVQKYLEKCFHLCWLMQAQYPSMLMDFETKPGMAFNTNVFEAYTNRGPKVDRVVWPPVNLHKDGPLVCKWYAEGTKQ